MRTAILVACASLLIAAAIAQPAPNAPVLSVYNYVKTWGDKSASATTEPVMLPGWVFIGTSDGIYGMNTSTNAVNGNGAAEYYVALPGVTMLIGITENTFIAIANNTIALFSATATNVTWVNKIVSKDSTFDLKVRQNYGWMTSGIYPGFAGNLMFIGTKNLTYNSDPYSTIYAVNVMDLTVAWETKVPFDTTNYATATYNSSEYVWIVTQNTRAGSTNNLVWKLYKSNGTLVDFSIDTQEYGFAAISVSEGLIGITTDYDVQVWAVNGTAPLYKSSSSYSSTIIYQPVIINGTWYFVTDDQLVMIEPNTLTVTTKSFPNTISAGSIRLTGMAPNGGAIGDAVFAAGCYVYSINSTGVHLIYTYTNFQYSSYCQPTGAQFTPLQWLEGGSDTTVSEVVYLSYYSSNGGVIVLMNYKTGEIYAQAAAADVYTVGNAYMNPWTNSIYVASSSSYTGGAILAGFQLPTVWPWQTGAIGFATTVADSDSVTDTNSLVFNQTANGTYYISQSRLFWVDKSGMTTLLGEFSQTVYSLQMNPIILGNYLVIVDSYYEKLYYFSQATGLSAGATVCDPSSTASLFAVGMTAFFKCSGDGAASIDFSQSPPAISASDKFGTDSFYGNIAVTSDYLLGTYSNTLLAYDLTASTGTAKWSSKISGTGSYMTSGPAVLDGNAYATVYDGSGQGSLYKVFLSLRFGLEVTKLPGVTSSTTNTIIAKQGGVFGSAGMLYIIGTNITGVNADSHAVVFTYAHNVTQYGSIVAQNGLNPTVLDNGAVCFYTTDYFIVVGGFEGKLAWAYKLTSSSSNQYAISTDGHSIFFVDGYYVVAADIYTGALTMKTSYGYSNSIKGYAIKVLENVTIVVVAAEHYVYTTSVNFFPSPAGANPVFPGSGGAAGGGSGGVLSTLASKAWIAGVVVGVIVIVVVIVIIQKKKSSAGSGSDYVSMNPASNV